MSSDASHHRRLLFKSWSRAIHIYISMLGLLSVIFFSVTGIMLNHEEWFGFATPHIVKKEGSIFEAMDKEPDKLAIVEKLRKDFSATGALDSFDIEDDILSIAFKSPGTPHRRHHSAGGRPRRGHLGVVRLQRSHRRPAPRHRCRTRLALHPRRHCRRPPHHLRDWSASLVSRPQMASPRPRRFGRVRHRLRCRLLHVGPVGPPHHRGGNRSTGVPSSRFDISIGSPTRTSAGSTW